MPNMTGNVMSVYPGHPEDFLEALFCPRKYPSYPENSLIFAGFIHKMNYLSWSDPRRFS
jgi:hypothetical protein